MGTPLQIDRDFFGHLLNCLANQKFLYAITADGLARDAVQRENQAIIDQAWQDGMALLHGEPRPLHLPVLTMPGGQGPPPLTEEKLERIAWYAQQASQPPVCVIQVPDGADPVEWCQDAVLRTAGETAYGVALGTPGAIESGEVIMTAFTGNGTASLANANFYMLCHTAVPVLVAEVRRLWKEKFLLPHGGEESRV